MNGLFISLGVLCLVGLGFYLLNRKIDRRLETSALVEKIRHEVDEILIELNSTTERNVGLIEDRIRSLTSLLAQTDRKLGVLRRELDKHSRSTDVYTAVREAARPVGDAARSDAVQCTEQPVTPRTEEVASQQIPRRPDDPRQRGTDRGTIPTVGKPSVSSGLDGARGEAAAGGPKPDKQRLRDAVRALRDQGLSLEQIAAKLGSTIGEVELTLSLLERAAEDGRNRQ